MLKKRVSDPSSKPSTDPSGSGGEVAETPRRCICTSFSVWMVLTRGKVEPAVPPTVTRWAFPADQMHLDPAF